MELFGQTTAEKWGLLNIFSMIDLNEWLFFKVKESCLDNNCR